MAIKGLKIKQIGLKRIFFHDLYHRVIKASWINFLLTSAFFYVLLNVIFALLYFYSPAVILNARPDSLIDAFIFSFQTSSTLGYGFLLPKSNLAHAIVVIDTMMGIFYVAIMTGLAFSKFSKPNAKIEFSDKAIIKTFDGLPTLTFRLANSRDTHIIDASLNVAVLIPYTSKEGHEMRRFYPLKLISNNNPTFSMSWTVMHQIDETSPLHGLHISEYTEKEIIVFVSFTGIDDVLSQTIHSNFRYTSDHILKAKKFVDILKVVGTNSYSIDFNKFHDIEV